MYPDILYPAAIRLGRQFILPFTPKRGMVPDGEAGCAW